MADDFDLTWQPQRITVDVGILSSKTVLERVQEAVRCKISAGFDFELTDDKGAPIRSNLALCKAAAAQEGVPLLAVPSEQSKELLRRSSDELQDLRARAATQRFSELEHRLNVLAAQLSDEVRLRERSMEQLEAKVNAMVRSPSDSGFMNLATSPVDAASPSRPATPGSVCPTTCVSNSAMDTIKTTVNTICLTHRQQLLQLAQGMGRLSGDFSSRIERLEDQAGLPKGGSTEKGGLTPQQQCKAVEDVLRPGLASTAGDGGGAGEVGALGDSRVMDVVSETCRSLVAQCEVSLCESLQVQLHSLVQQQRDTMYSSLKAEIQRELAGSCSPRSPGKHSAGSQPGTQQPPLLPGTGVAPGSVSPLGTCMPTSYGSQLATSLLTHSSSEAGPRDGPLCTAALTPFGTGTGQVLVRGAVDKQDSFLVGDDSVNLDTLISVVADLQSTSATATATPLSRTSQAFPVARHAVVQYFTPRAGEPSPLPSAESCGSPPLPTMASAVLVRALSPQPTQSALVHQTPAAAPAPAAAPSLAAAMPAIRVARSPSAGVGLPRSPSAGGAVYSGRGREGSHQSPRAQQPRQQVQRQQSLGGQSNSGGEALEAAVAVASSACDSAAARRWRMCRSASASTLGEHDHAVVHSTPRAGALDRCGYSAHVLPKASCGPPPPMMKVQLSAPMSERGRCRSIQPVPAMLVQSMHVVSQPAPLSARASYGPPVIASSPTPPPYRPQHVATRVRPASAARATTPAPARTLAHVPTH